MILENASIIVNIEIYILLFFTYAFAGWFMESVGGIINEKKFVNRGFLIGPYCPVYGYGVVAITILLRKYINDIPALFILSTVICGTLEYATSYIMEKLFNARWWDYHNRKFNINGRICLETLLPFGIAGSVILYFINPFFINLYLKIPELIRHIITIGLLAIFVIDSIISFIIILSFRGETYKSRDNTEEISTKVKDKTEELSTKVIDKTEDIIMKAESDAIHFGRKVRIKGLDFRRKVKYTRKKISNAIIASPKELAERVNESSKYINKRITEGKEKIDNQIKLKRAEIEMKQKESAEIIDKRIQKTKEDFEEFQKASKEKVDNTIKNIKITSEEFTKQVKERFKTRSLLRRRLINAFPSLQIIVKERKTKNKDTKK